MTARWNCTQQNSSTYIYLALYVDEIKRRDSTPDHSSTYVGIIAEEPPVSDLRRTVLCALCSVARTLENQKEPAFYNITIHCFSLIHRIFHFCLFQVWFQNKRSKERRLKQLNQMGRGPFFSGSRRMRTLNISPGSIEDAHGDPFFAYGRFEFAYSGAPGAVHHEFFGHHHGPPGNLPFPGKKHFSYYRAEPRPWLGADRAKTLNA